MRKNQKAYPATDGYSKEEMYLAIELWQESGHYPRLSFVSVKTIGKKIQLLVLKVQERKENFG